LFKTNGRIDDVNINVNDVTHFVWQTVAKYAKDGIFFYIL